MDKFRQISKEFWPLIYVKISFPGSIWSIYWPIFFKFCIGVYIRKKWFWTEDGNFSFKNYKVMALDLHYQDILCICTELNLCGGVSCMPAALLL